MSSFTRRKVLAGGALVGVAVSVSGAARGNIGDAVLQSCPDCLADLALGDLHAPDCRGVGIVQPSDKEINVDALRTAQAPKGQKARGPECAARCGSLMTDTKKNDKKEKQKQKKLSPY